MKVSGLFSGIGGLELPFSRRMHETVILCDNWEPSRRVLSRRFPDVDVRADVRDLRSLPSDTEVLTAGFPCTDLSQAGRTAGITGKDSGLVDNVFRLLKKDSVDWLVLENVRNMLVLNGGAAMGFLTSELEDLGFQWAYRLVDSRFTGVPQRRQRVLMVASRSHDPTGVLFADDAGEPEETPDPTSANGFYWTEGLRGLGWADNAVPTLKGGSSVGIPSPPGIWMPAAPLGRRVVTPSIEDAEALQGFPRGWTAPASTTGKNGPRWKLVGNAVTVGVADWLVSRLDSPGQPGDAGRLVEVPRWPIAASGHQGRVKAHDVSMWPVRHARQPLGELLDHDGLSPLSYRATAGFLERAARSRLRFSEDFLLDMKQHAAYMSAQHKPVL